MSDNPEADFWRDQCHRFYREGVAYGRRAALGIPEPGDRPLMTGDLDVCASCGGSAQAWTSTPGGESVGWCGSRECAERIVGREVDQ